MDMVPVIAALELNENKDERNTSSDTATSHSVINSRHRQGKITRHDWDTGRLESIACMCNRYDVWSGDQASVTDFSAVPRSVLTATVACVRDKLGVLVERTLADLERRGNPRLLSSSELRIGYVHVERVGDGVDVNHVAVLQQCNGTSDLSFGSHVANDKAVRTATSAAW